MVICSYITHILVTGGCRSFNKKSLEMYSKDFFCYEDIKKDPKVFPFVNSIDSD